MSLDQSVSSTQPAAIGLIENGLDQSTHPISGAYSVVNAVHACSLSYFLILKRVSLYRYLGHTH